MVLLVLTDWKGKSYNSILIIVDRFIKMVNYKLIKIMINVSGLAEVIIDVVIWHHSLFDSIITDWGSLFISKFWFSLCYSLRIKRRFSIVSHPQTNSQIKRENNTMKAYLRAFVNWKQNDCAHLLPMAEFVYNNAKNSSTSHTLFELNYNFHPEVSFEDNVNPRSRSCSANKLTKELRKLIDIC